MRARLLWVCEPFWSSFLLRVSCGSYTEYYLRCLIASSTLGRQNKSLWQTLRWGIKSHTETETHAIITARLHCGDSLRVSTIAVSLFTLHCCRSRYTWYNFLPRFLLEQFARFANAYFLLVAILQTIKDISITDGIPSTFLPLSAVLSFDGFVTAREDYKRHKDDARANQSTCEHLQPMLCRSVLCES